MSFIVITDYLNDDMQVAFELLCDTGNAVNVASGFDTMKRHADAGDMTACAVVGWASRLRHVGHYDLKLSREYLERSADSGNALGQYYLGDLLITGQEPFGEDKVYGKWLLEQSSSQGCEEAQALLDCMYGKVCFWNLLVIVVMTYILSLLDREAK